jgi:hypothetical protein
MYKLKSAFLFFQIFFILCALDLGAATVAVGPTNSDLSLEQFPFSRSKGGARTQMLIKKSEIGLSSGGGQITRLYFYFNENTVTTAMGQFSVKIQNTTLEALNANFISDGFTPCYSGSWTPATGAGWRSVDLNSPFDWDGVSNLLIEICWTNNAATGGAGSRNVTAFKTDFTSVVYKTQARSATCSSISTINPETSDKRPIVKFDININPNSCVYYDKTQYYGYLDSNVTSTIKDVKFSAVNLNSIPSSIVCVPPEDVMVSLDGSEWKSYPDVLNIPYSTPNITEQIVKTKLKSGATNASIVSKDLLFRSADNSLSWNINLVARNRLQYCESYPSSYADEDVGRVAISNLDNGSSVPLYNNPTANKTYSDFRESLAPVLLRGGCSYPLSVSVVNYSTTAKPCSLKVYIDYNRDGVYNETNERVMNVSSGGGQDLTSDEWTTSVNVPENINTSGNGLTGMRVVLAQYNSSGACGVYSYGETEDYTVRLLPAQDMRYSNYQINQISEEIIPAGSVNAKLLKVTLNMDGSSNPIQFKKMRFSASSSNLLNSITKAKLWYSVAQDDFTKAVELGTFLETSVINGEIIFIPNTNFNLISGKNIFWLSVDVSKNARLDAKLDADLREIILSDNISDNKVNGIDSPEGYALISGKKFDGSFSGGSLLPNLWINSVAEIGSGAGTTPAWTSVGAVSYPAIAPTSSPSMAKFNSAYAKNASSALLVSPAFFMDGANRPNEVSLKMRRVLSSSSVADCAKISVYINTAPNLNGASQLYLSDNSAINELKVLSRFEPIVESTGWYKYSFSIPSNYNSGDNYIIIKGVADRSNDIYIDDIDLGFDAYMEYLSSSKVDMNDKASPIGVKNEVVGQFEIKTRSSNKAFEINSIKINKSATSDINDIEKIKLWSVADYPNFNSDNAILVAEAASFVGDVAQLTKTVACANFNFAEGVNKFVITYDIKKTALENNIIDAELTEITLERDGELSNIALENLNSAGLTTLKAPLSGIYKVGGQGTDFSDLNSAALALNTLGAKSDVGFAINSDITLEEINAVEFTPIKNLSEKKIELTIFPLNKERKLSGNLSGADNALIKLLGVDNIVIDGRVRDVEGNLVGDTNSCALTFENLADGSCLLIGNSAMGDPSADVAIKYCKFLSKSNSNSDNAVGVNIAGKGCERILIERDIFKRISVGVYANNYNMPYSRDIIVKKCVFGDTENSSRLSRKGISLSGITNAKISNNTLCGLGSEELYIGYVHGIYINSNVDSLLIEANKISNVRNLNSSAYGIYAINLTTSVGVKNVKIVNNTISDLNAYANESATKVYTYGIRFNGGENIKLVNNTVSLSGIPSGPGKSWSACLVVDNALTKNLRIRNNIFTNSMNHPNLSSKIWTIYADKGYKFSDINSNNYYLANTSTNANVAYYGSDLKDFVAWKAALASITGNYDLDNNSKNIPVEFTSDLHLDKSAISAKELICAIDDDATNDMDEQTRELSRGRTQMGADEANPVLYWSEDIKRETITLCENDVLKLTVSAKLDKFTDGIERSKGASEINYEWYLGGSLIANQNDRELVFTGIDKNYVNYIYVEAYAGEKFIRSESKEIFIEKDIKILAQPQKYRAICSNIGSTKLSVELDGSVQKIQWQTRDSESDMWKDIKNANSDVYTIMADNLANKDKIYYRAKINGKSPCAQSELFTESTEIKISYPIVDLAISSAYGDNINLCEGSEFAIIQKSATGTINQYIWEKQVNNDFMPIKSKNIQISQDYKTLKFTNANKDDGGLYRLTLIGSSDCSETGEYAVSSNIISVNIKPYATFTSQPKPQLLCIGGQAALSAKTNGINANYQWRKDGKNIDISENRTAKSAMLVINNASFADIGIYSCVVESNSCAPNNSDGLLVSDQVLVYVLDETKIIDDISDQYLMRGSTARFEVNAHASGKIENDYMEEYQWYNNGVALQNNKKYAGVNSSILTVTNVSEMDENSNFTVRIKGICGGVISSKSARIIISAVEFVNTFSDTSACENSEIKLNASVRASNENSEIHYQWFRNNIKISDSKELAILANESTAGEYFTRAYTIDPAQYTQSNSFKISVTAKPLILSQSANINVAKNTQFALNVNVKGDNMKYLWTRNGVNIVGATSDTLKRIEAESGDYTYAALITNECGAVEASAIKVHVSDNGNNGGSTTGVQESISGLVIGEISPNPATTKASFNLIGESNGAITVELYDASGKMINRIFNGIINNFQKIDINLSDAPNGSYFIKIYDARESLTKRIVVNK